MKLKILGGAVAALVAAAVIATHRSTTDERNSATGVANSKPRERVIDANPRKHPTDLFQNPPLGTPLIGYDPRKVNPKDESLDVTQERLRTELARIGKMESSKDKLSALAFLISNLNRDFGLGLGVQIEQFLKTEIPDPDRTDLLRDLAAETANENRNLVVELIPNAPAGRKRTLIGAALSKFDSAALATWLTDLTNDPDSSRVVMDIASFIGNNDGNVNLTESQIKDLVKSLPDSPIRNVLAQRLGSVSPLPRDLSYATTTSGLPQDIAQKYAKNIYSRVVSERPEAFKEILMMGDVPVAIKDSVASAAVQAKFSTRMSINDALNQQSDLSGVGADAYWRAFGREWLNRDAALAESTISGLKPGRQRDILTAEVVRRKISSDANAAALLVESIADPDVRESLVAEINRGKQQ